MEIKTDSNNVKKQKEPPHKCWYCGGSGFIKKDGKLIPCPECGGSGGYWGSP